MRRTLGPYQLVRRLGRGGMAEVHLAIAHGAAGFERRVALKTLAPELAGDPELERALIREATLAGALHHRNVVGVHGLGCDDGLYYVVLQYLDGGDLARHLRDGEPMPAPLARYVVAELARGLAHLHAATGERGLPLGLVHRDVGPANALVSTSGDVVLADFGIAKATALADLTSAGARKGRYAYMAPEQLAGEPVTAAADQFGLAVTLVELCAGARPFAGETPWALLDAIRAGARFAASPASPLAASPHAEATLATSPASLASLASPVALPADVAAIARRALAFDPAARFASVDDLRRALAAPIAGPEDLASWLLTRVTM